MTKNQWDVEVVTDAADFSCWDWGEDYGEAYEAFVREISVSAAKVVVNQLIEDAMFDLQPGEQDATIWVILLGDDLVLQTPLGALIAAFIEGLEDRETNRIEGAEERETAERLIEHLERAAARIRDVLV